MEKKDQDKNTEKKYIIELDILKKVVIMKFQPK